MRKEKLISKSGDDPVRQIVVLYDGWCPFCKESIKRFKRLDWFKRIEFLSFRDSEYVDIFNLDIQKLENRIHSIKSHSHEIEDGIYCINRICKNTPLLWLMVPFLTLASFIGLGQKTYDWIARRRTIIPTGQCDSSTCEMPLEDN
ncbi:thiol-disulfide oxidoreductase DCC family protein [Piscibacillus salipiscarius]|uniref:Thiol-disulfide oxidoreductase DCC family protein n=1 Tax=Piscibacillus salipiscarius TaxID=299480 RepID=A0ABW5QB54_9BACI|nr:DUF393 domain-containing protein [Piscibacillus salipiscarius]